MPVTEAIERGDLDQATRYVFEHMNTAAARWAAEWRARQRQL